MSSIECEGFIEDLQDWIAANSGLGLSVGVAGTTGNFTVGDVLNLADLDDLIGSEILCSAYEEGGRIIRTGRRHRQERSIRFVWKGEHGQGAVNLCWRLLKFLENKKRFSTTTFTAMVARHDKLPAVFLTSETGKSLADFVTTFFVFNRTG